MAKQALPMESMVRRADVLLRAEYPALQTRIFQIHTHHFVIFFDKELHTVADISEHFEQRIKPAGLSISLTNALPASFLKEIPGISDALVAKGFEGFPFSRPAIRNVLLGKHPDLPLSARNSNSNNPIVFFVTAPLTDSQESNARNVIEQILPGWPVRFDLDTEGEEKPLSPQVQQRMKQLESIDVKPSALRKGGPSFTRADEAFWYDNVDSIFEGRLSSRSIMDQSDDGMACYINSSSFSQIDLRQAVLSYDTVYLTPPISDGNRAPDFWNEQAVSKEDVLRLIEVGRVRLVLAQPEERTDPAFLEAAYERHPKAILGRLSAAAFLASDVIATANEYKLAKPGLNKELTLLANHLAPELKVSTQTAMKILLWPTYARRASISPLMNRGIMGVSTFGLGSLLAEELQGHLDKDYALEAIVTSDDIHIAHALNATFLPPTNDMEGWLLPRQIVGDRLNFYRSYNSRIAASWAINERRKEERRVLLPPFELFRFEKHAPIEDLIALTSLGSTRRKGRALIGRLVDLTDEQRAAEIEALARDLYNMGARRGRSKVALDTAANAFDVATSLANITVFPIKSALELFKLCVAIARRVPKLDNLLDIFESDLAVRFGSNEDLEFLSKMSRVARLYEAD